MAWRGVKGCARRFRLGGHVWSGRIFLTICWTGCCGPWRWSGARSRLGDGVAQRSAFPDAVWERGTRELIRNGGNSSGRHFTTRRGKSGSLGKPGRLREPKMISFLGRVRKMREIRRARISLGADGRIDACREEFRWQETRKTRMRAQGPQQLSPCTRIFRRKIRDRLRYLCSRSHRRQKDQNR